MRDLEQADTDFTHAQRVMQEKYLAEIEESFLLPVTHVPCFDMKSWGKYVS